MAAKSSGKFGQPTEAMLRNGLQALFLDEKFRTALYDHLRPNKRAELMALGQERRIDYHATLLERNKHHWAYNDYYKEHNPKQYAEAAAEVAEQQGKINELRAVRWKPRPVEVRFELGADVHLCPLFSHLGGGSAVVRITIKPVLTDDYPKLLRAMKKAEANTLFCTGHELIGLTLDQVRKIFEVEGIRIVFRSELTEGA